MAFCLSAPWRSHRITCASHIAADSTVCSRFTGAFIAGVIERVGCAETANALVVSILRTSDAIAIDLIGEEAGEAVANRRDLGRKLNETSGQHAKLHGNYDFLLTGNAKGDDQICFYCAILANGEISAAVVGCQSGLAGRIAEFRKPREEGTSLSGWDAKFKEVGQDQRGSDGSDPYPGAYRKQDFMIIPVAEQQVQINYHISGDGDVLGSEDGSAPSSFVAFMGVCVQDPLRAGPIGPYYCHWISIGILYEGRP